MADDDHNLSSQLQRRDEPGADKTGALSSLDRSKGRRHLATGLRRSVLYRLRKAKRAGRALLKRPLQIPLFFSNWLPSQALRNLALYRIGDAENHITTMRSEQGWGNGRCALYATAVFMLVVYEAVTKGPLHAIEAALNTRLGIIAACAVAICSVGLIAAYYGIDGEQLRRALEFVVWIVRGKGG